MKDVLEYTKLPPTEIDEIKSFTNWAESALRNLSNKFCMEPMEKIQDTIMNLKRNNNGQQILATPAKKNRIISNTRVFTPIQQQQTSTSSTDSFDSPINKNYTLSYSSIVQETMENANIDADDLF